jgi:hypothetical protein
MSPQQKSLGRSVPQKMRPLQDAALGYWSLGHDVPDRCVLTREMHRGTCQDKLFRVIC